MVFTHHEALDVLDARYAKGELDREDYMRRKADILGQKA
ncbi:MAG: SHOCT domain-containing protein [Alphaproteobacteria bacterium]|nr:SHOCT domain-containing protein [Alphaproteobacteria bacterium]